jgi:hypothetical protein
MAGRAKTLEPTVARQFGFVRCQVAERGSPTLARALRSIALRFPDDNPPQLTFPAPDARDKKF